MAPSTLSLTVGVRFCVTLVVFPFPFAAAPPADFFSTLPVFVLPPAAEEVETRGAEVFALGFPPLGRPGPLVAGAFLVDVFGVSTAFLAFVAAFLAVFLTLEVVLVVEEEASGR